MENKRPSDIRPQWYKQFLKIVRRLQSVGRNNDGFAIVSITVLINKDGNPVFYTEPKMILLEPKRAIDIQTLQNELGDEGLEKILQLIMLNN